MNEYKHGGDIYSNKVDIDFSANINPFGMPKGVRQAVEQAVGECIHYPDPKCQKLVETIAQKEEIQPQNILCGNGAADLIFRFVFAIKPKKALVLAPCFSEYEDALRAVDCEVNHHHLKAEDNFSLKEDFLEKMTTKLDVIFLCNPNNPTGILIDKELLEKIQRKCKEQQIYLFLDECFLDFVEQGEKRSLKKSLQSNQMLIILRAFTKMYGMAGLRLGYCMSGNLKLLQRIRFCGQSWSVSTLAQVAGIAALKEIKYVEHTKEYIQTQKKYLLENLKKLGISYCEPTANYIFFYWDKEDLYSKCLEQGILIRSCHNYIGLGYGYYRIAMKQEAENRKFIETLRGIVKGE